MSYIRFWLRCCTIFIPGCFLLLFFGAHQSLLVSFFWALGIPLGGFLLVAPAIISFGRVDRSLWSRQAEMERRRRHLEYLEKLRREEYGED